MGKNKLKICIKKSQLNISLNRILSLTFGFAKKIMKFGPKLEYPAVGHVKLT